MLVNGPTPPNGGDAHAAARHAARGAFGSRAAVAAAGVATFAALAWADATALWGARPAWWLLPVAFTLAGLGAAELAALTAAAGRPIDDPLVVAGTCGIVYAAALGGASPGPPVAALGWVAAACMAVSAACFVVGIARYRPHEGALARVVAGLATAIGLGLPLAFLVALRLMCRTHASTGDAERLGLLPLLSLVAVVKVGDIAAYLAGSVAGRHRMAPLLSPGKTWEGAAASLAASCAVAWLLLEQLSWSTVARPWGGWLVFGACVGAAGMIGDLAESLVKRELGAKDSGRSLGGLGGVLDLVDSLLVAAPVAWLLWVMG